MEKGRLPTTLMPDLDGIGRWILTAVDYRVLGLLCLGAALPFGIVRYWRDGGLPPFSEFLRVGSSIAAIYGAVTIAAVFLMTKPPAVELLSSESYATIGFVVTLSLLFHGIPELVRLFNPQVDERPPSKETPPKPSVSAASSPSLAERRRGNKPDPRWYLCGDLLWKLSGEFLRDYGEYTVDQLSNPCDLEDLIKGPFCRSCRRYLAVPWGSCECGADLGYVEDENAAEREAILTAARRYVFVQAQAALHRGETPGETAKRAV